MTGDARVHPVLHRALLGARLRVAARVVAFAIPVAAMLAVVAWRWGSEGWIHAAIASGAIAMALAAWLSVRQIDSVWLARRLDARDPRMEDSSFLLFTPSSRLTPVEQLQRNRLRQRLESAPSPDLRPAWYGRALLAVLLGASSITSVIVAWPASAPTPRQTPPSQTQRNVAGSPAHTRIIRQSLDIVPPGYTRLPRRHEDQLETRVPEGSTIRWTLRLAPSPTAASLAFHDGRKLALVRKGDDWIATGRIDKPMLYRVVVEDAPPLRPDRLHRIEVTIDQPPRLKVIAPDNTLTLRSANQRAWSLSFEASDDYGLMATAPLRITLAQGSGENITFQERTLSLPGRGGAKQKRYAHTFDLAPLGLTAGDDLIVQLAVTDNRARQPQTTRSASYILRWPPEDAAESTGLDGLVKKTLPAYFRSQRQIIIDSEALLKQRRKLASDAYIERSDAIGVDQHVLRLRYGQFLGEESEGRPLLPTADAEPEAESSHSKDGSDHATAGEPEAATPVSPAHDHDEPASASAFGEAEDVLESYGHTHDDSEAATLLDPETRKTLKAALDQMWQAELHLRQGRPDLALPYEYKALDFIKQVQQAGRIYLARVGPELPPIDENRRLTGDRKGLAARNDPLVPAEPAPPLLTSLWRALQTPPGADAPALDLDGAERWLRTNEHRVADALGVIAAIDSVRREPECASCRRVLRSRLWPLLPRPLANPALRPQPDRSGRAYLDALQQVPSQ